ncbi:MAG: Appr-1-p processing protein [Actinobacteria bacterium RBG_16_64_13]|nr:MAG: Appr-1-p processing protein [Actinobacteria bacterium RBG_16_64_13]
MVNVRIGDLFTSQAQTLVNTVNCVGIMGKGIALEFKKRFPDMFKDYARRCELGEVRLGEPYLYRGLFEPWIINFPTKEHWRSVSRLEDIERGLLYLRDHVSEWGVKSMAVPPLGCGEGQLEWRVVGPTLYRCLKDLAVPVELYAPIGTAHAELSIDFLDKSGQSPPSAGQYRIGPGWIAVVEILRQLEKEPNHRPVGRTTFQKIVYFATQSGIPTDLQFERGSYGPFSSEIKRRVTALVNNGLLKEERIGQMFAVHVGPTYTDAHQAYRSELESWSGAIEKVADLFLRMDTELAEIAATVHFAAQESRSQLPAASEADVLRAVLEWKQKRRPPLDADKVAKSIRHLNMLSWVGLSFSDDLPVAEEDVLGA